MNILWLKSDLLLPLDKGGRLRTWHLMRHLAKRHDITYLSFAENGQQREAAGMREVARRVVTVARLYPEVAAKPTWVVRTGVDTEYFLPSASQPSEPHLVFTGSMDWLPNEDAMKYFCQDVFPLIREQEPHVSLSIVGRAPTPAV